MVTTQMMNENEMGNRGSKSVISTVKEQRVDGSWSNYFLNNFLLRCTLTGREICYQIKILTNQLNNKTYSTLSTKPKINPWFITGFSDAEGSFIISIYRDIKSKLQWRVTAYFSIHVHIKDIEL